MNWLSFFHVNIATITLCLAAFVSANLGLVIYFGSKERSFKIWALISLIMALYLLVMGALVSMPDQGLSFFQQELQAFFARLGCFLGVVMVMLFYVFCQLFPDKQKIHSKNLYPLIFILFFFFVVLFFTDLIIGVKFELANSANNWLVAPLFPLYTISICGFLLAGVSFLYKKMREELDLFKKNKLTLCCWQVFL